MLKSSYSYQRSTVSCYLKHGAVMLPAKTFETGSYANAKLYKFVNPVTAALGSCEGLINLYRLMTVC